MLAIFIALLAIASSEVITADIMVRLQRLSLGCELNNVLYYAASQWNSDENLTKMTMLSLNLTEPDAKPTTLIEYGTESLSNFVCLDVVYFLKNGQITAFIGDDTFVSYSNLPVGIDTFKMVLNEEGDVHGVASLTVFPSMTLEESAAKFVELETQRYRVYDELMIRRWDTYWDGQYQHLFTFVLGESNEFEFTDIMNDLKHDCPARPFGGSEEYDISPNGDVIAFSILLENAATSLDNNIYTASFSNPTQANWNCISCENIAYDNQPAFNNDGSKLFYLAMDEPKDESDKASVMVYTFSDETIQNITGHIDMSFSAPMSFVDDYVHLPCTIEGNSYIVGFDTTKEDLTSNDINIITPKGTAGAFAITPLGLIFEYNNFTLPTELFLYEDQTTTQLTFINEEVLSTITFGDVKNLYFTGANDDEIHAFLHYPPNFDSQQKYPVILYTHGGPESPWTNDFHYRWNPQVIAAQGYLVYAINFHGSGSYGDAFMKSIRGNWGGWPYEDLMKGMDYLPTFEPAADTDNACAMGASYGGYMMNWLNANTDRFKCIICHDGIIDTEGSYYYMDELYFLDVEFKGAEYENPEGYKKYNPIEKINNFKTPQLTIHGGTDYRIDLVAGIEQFVTLQRKNIESKLVVYPEENHWVLRPFNSIDWHAQVFDWLQIHLTN
ncbi:Dipeptidyl-peptidase 5 [Entamoeba marina]